MVKRDEQEYFTDERSGTEDEAEFDAIVAVDHLSKQIDEGVKDENTVLSLMRHLVTLGDLVEWKALEPVFQQVAPLLADFTPARLLEFCKSAH